MPTNKASKKKPVKKASAAGRKKPASRNSSANEDVLTRQSEIRLVGDQIADLEQRLLEMSRFIRPNRRSYLNGDLSNVLLCELVQTFGDHKIDVMLAVRSAEGVGEMVIFNGQVISAYWKDIKDPKQAAMEILAQELVNVKFDFLPPAKSKAGTSITSLLMESARLRDEKDKERERVQALPPKPVPPVPAPAPPAVAQRLAPPAVQTRPALPGKTSTGLTPAQGTPARQPSPTTRQPAPASAKGGGVGWGTTHGGQQRPGQPGPTPPGR